MGVSLIVAPAVSPGVYCETGGPGDTVSAHASGDTH